MKKNVYTDGNGSSTIHVQGMGDYVPVSQLVNQGKLIEVLTKVSDLSNLDMNDFYYLIDNVVDDATDLLNEIKEAS